MSDDSTTTRRRLLIGLGTGATIAVAGCSGGGDGGSTPTETPTQTRTGTPTQMTTETPTGTGNVRVAHMSPNAPDVDVYVDGSAALEDVPFGAVSQYLEVPAGDRQVEITAAGDPDASVFSGAIPIAAETDYTITAISEVGNSADPAIEPLVLQDDNSAPGNDTARVRLVHASPDAPAVDVTLASSGDVVFDGLSYGDASTVEVPAGEYTLQVRGDTGSNDGDVAAEFDVRLDGGGVYTAFAAGYFDPEFETDAPFDLVVAQASCGMGGGGTANVRVAHMSPNAPNVDVVVDDTAILEDVPFGAVSEYLELAAGSPTVEITDTADPDATVLYVDEVTLAADTDYTIVAAGEIMGERSFELIVLEDDNSGVGDDTARLRTVHASPDAPAVDITASATGDTLFDGVGFGEAGSIEVPASDYTVEIRGDTESSDGEVVAEFDDADGDGQVYTAFATGYLSTDDESVDVPLELVVAHDTESTSG
jgi:hypothetical protein